MATQLETLLTKKYFKGESLLAVAAQKRERTYLEAVRTRLTPQQVRVFEMLLKLTSQSYSFERKPFYCVPEVGSLLFLYDNISYLAVKYPFWP